MALYVETAVARKELRRLQDEGFFKGQGYTDDSLTAALNAGRFRKCLQIQMLRSASGKGGDAYVHSVSKGDKFPSRMHHNG